MTRQLSDHVLSIVRDLLEVNWVPANTAGYDPTLASSDSDFLLIHTASYNYNPRDPQVAVTSFEEGVVGGGTTSYTGMQGDGSGLNQDRDGTVFIDCWAAGDATYNGEHPQDIVDLLMKEVERVLHDHSEGGTTDFRRLNPGSPFTNDDADADPVVYGQQLAAGYGYLKEPPA